MATKAQQAPTLVVSGTTHLLAGDTLLTIANSYLEGFEAGNVRGVAYGESQTVRTIQGELDIIGFTIADGLSDSRKNITAWYSTVTPHYENTFITLYTINSLGERHYIAGNKIPGRRGFTTADNIYNTSFDGGVFPVVGDTIFAEVSYTWLGVRHFTTKEGVIFDPNN